jgi:F-type H+-transporting ATPase subunit b
MSVLGFIIRPMAECGIDSNGECVTHSPILPETPEIIWGGLASLLVFVAIVKFAGPAIKKGLSGRTAKIQAELDGAVAARSAAATEAAGIRAAKGDIGAERARILAEAEAQAAAVIEDGRVRLDQELRDIDAKAVTDIAASRGRVTDELRAEIARLSNAAVDHVVTGSLDDATHQELIESFIARVGASS